MGRGRGGNTDEGLLESDFSAADYVLSVSANKEGQLHSESGKWSLIVPRIKDLDAEVLDEMIKESGEDISFLEGKDREAARADFVRNLAAKASGGTLEGVPYDGNSSLIQWHCRGQLVAEIDEDGEVKLHDFEDTGEFVVEFEDETFVAKNGKFSASV